MQAAESVRGRGRKGCWREAEKEQMHKASKSFETPPSWKVARLAVGPAAVIVMAVHLVALEGRTAPSSHCFPMALNRLRAARR